MRLQRLMENVLAGCAWLVLLAIVLRWVSHVATDEKSPTGKSGRWLGHRRVR
jgi:hypothetical protein